MSRGRYMNTYMDQDLKDILTAIAYQVGLKGQSSRLSKKFIMEGIQRYQEGLPPSKRAELDEILSNVKIASLMNPKKRIQKSTYIRKKQRGGI